MHQQEDITHLPDSTFNGPFPFSTDGVIVGLPTAGFAEEMQTKITFQNGSISARHVPPREHAPVVGRQRLRGHVQPTFFKEGYATMSQDFTTARTRRTTPAASARRPVTRRSRAAWSRASTRFYNGTSTEPLERVAPSNPTNATPVQRPRPRTRARARPTSRCAAILGKDNFAEANKEIQRDLRRRLDHRAADQIASSTSSCRTRAPAATPSSTRSSSSGGTRPTSGSPAAGNKPQITGPGLAGRGFYDATGGCSDYGRLRRRRRAGARRRSR